MLRKCCVMSRVNIALDAFRAIVRGEYEPEEGNEREL